MQELKDFANVNNLTLRLLENKEFEREDFKQLMKEYKYEAVDPYTCKILIAEEKDGEIMAALVCKPRFHVEPLIIKPKYKRTFLASRMYKKLIKLYENYKGLPLYIFSHRKAINIAAKRVGFVETPYTVLRKEIT